MPEAMTLREPLAAGKPVPREKMTSLPEAEEPRDLGAMEAHIDAIAPGNPCTISERGSAGSLMADMTGHEKFVYCPRPMGHGISAQSPRGGFADWEVSLVARG